MAPERAACQHSWRIHFDILVGGMSELSQVQVGWQQKWDEDSLASGTNGVLLSLVIFDILLHDNAYWW